MTQPEDPCAGCVYYAQAGAEFICEYILHAHHRRPCPFGAGCTVKRTQSEEETDMRKAWDKDKALELYRQGRSDAQIAEALGVEPGTVGAWRRKAGLPNLAARRRTDAGLDGEGTPAPAAVPGGAVAFTVEIDGAYAELRAPGLEQARELWRLMGVWTEHG